jgi:hypothetical protein
MLPSRGLEETGAASQGALKAAAYGIHGSKGSIATLVMSLTIVAPIMLVVDLDRPARGPIVVPVKALIDAAEGIPP